MGVMKYYMKSILTFLVVLIVYPCNGEEIVEKPNEKTLRELVWAVVPEDKEYFDGEMAVRATKRLEEIEMMESPSEEIIKEFAECAYNPDLENLLDKMNVRFKKLQTIMFASEDGLPPDLKLMYRQVSSLNAALTTFWITLTDDETGNYDDPAYFLKENHNARIDWNKKQLERETERSEREKALDTVKRIEREGRRLDSGDLASEVMMFEGGWDLVGGLDWYAKEADARLKTTGEGAPGLEERTRLYSLVEDAVSAARECLDMYREEHDMRPETRRADMRILTAVIEKLKPYLNKGEPRDAIYAPYLAVGDMPADEAELYLGEARERVKRIAAEGRRMDAMDMLAETDLIDEGYDAVGALEWYAREAGELVMGEKPRSDEEAFAAVELATRADAVARTLWMRLYRNRDYRPDTRTDDLRRVSAVIDTLAQYQRGYPNPGLPFPKMASRAAEPEEIEAARALVPEVEALLKQEKYSELVRRHMQAEINRPMDDQSEQYLLGHLREKLPLMQQILDSVAGRRDAAWRGFLQREFRHDVVCLPDPPIPHVTMIHFHRQPKEKEYRIILVMTDQQFDHRVLRIEESLFRGETPVDDTEE